VREVLFNRVPALIVVIALLVLVFKGSFNKGLFSFPRFLALSMLESAVFCLSGSFDNFTFIFAYFALARIDGRLDLRLFGFLKVHPSQLLFQLINNIIIAIEVNLLTNLRVLFNILEEHLVVLFVTLLRVLALLLAFSDRGFGIFISTFIFGEMLEFPKSVLPALAILWIGFLHEDYGRHLKFLVEFHVFKLH